MINTLNESHLHRTLKTLYANQEQLYRTEVELDNYIVDIFIEPYKIIEIQTQNVSSLKNKIIHFLDNGFSVKIVHPVVVEKIIETRNGENDVVKKRRSPKKHCVYSIFPELTGIHGLICRKNFSLDALEVKVTEERISACEKMQAPNKKRRFLKDWNKTGKRLDEIRKTWNFASRKDYLELIPEKCRNEISSKGIMDELKKSRVKATQKEINCMLWVMAHAGIIECTGKRGNLKLYRITEDDGSA